MVPSIGPIRNNLFQCIVGPAAVKVSFQKSAVKGAVSPVWRALTLDLWLLRFYLHSLRTFNRPLIYYAEAPEPFEYLIFILNVILGCTNIFLSDSKFGIFFLFQR